MYRPVAVGMNLVTCACAGGLRDFNIAMKTSVLLWVMATVPIVTETLVSFVASDCDSQRREISKTDGMATRGVDHCYQQKDQKQISLKYTHVCSDHFVSVKPSAMEQIRIRFLVKNCNIRQDVH